MDFLGLEEGGPATHGEADIQHSLLHIHEAEDVHIIGWKGEHLGQEVHQQLVAAPLLSSQLNELRCCDV